MPQLKEALTGNADMELKGGCLKGKSIKQDLLAALDNPILSQLLPGLKKEQEKASKEEKKETKINELVVSLGIGNGVITVNKMTADTDTAKLRGSGTVNFDLNANLKAQAVVSPALTALLMAGKELPDYLPQEEGGIMLPAMITGPLSNPTILPDISELLKAASKGVIKDKIGGLIGGKEGEGKKTMLPIGDILGGGESEKTEGTKEEGVKPSLKQLLPVGGEEKETGGGEEKKEKGKLPIKLPFGTDKSEEGEKKKGGFKLF
jgi:hypothetical protein